MFFLLWIQLSSATTLAIPLEGDVVGELEYVYPKSDATLGEIGLQYDMGYDEMMRANPHIDPTRPVPVGVQVLIPSQFILPKGPRQGVVINLAEYRLYYYPEGDNIVITYPVGIGRQGWSTPLGMTTIIAKQRHPSWHPSKALIAKAEEQGVLMPEVFPANRSNPLGDYALRLAWPGYLIHGTQHKGGVGERISGGCIRMLPEDIEFLFEQVSVGTSVRVINEPIKWGRLNGTFYVEIHPALMEQKKNYLHKEVQRQMKSWEAKINQFLVQQETIHPSGVPKKVALLN